MLGHYATYLSFLFYCTIYIGGSIFIKWSKRSLENDDDTIMLYTWYGHDTYHNISRGSQDLGILLSWLCTKYQYHFPLELLIFVSALLIRPMAYFYTFLRPGNQFHLAKLICHCVNLLFSVTIRWHETEQWLRTIFIFDIIITVLHTLSWLAQGENVDGTFTLLFSLSFGFILFTYCKDYVKRYVDLSKI